jgi:hypothetical protein
MKNPFLAEPKGFLGHFFNPVFRGVVGFSPEYCSEAVLMAFPGKFLHYSQEG